MNMAVLKLILLCYILRISASENIFMQRLNKLLDYCVMHEENVDSSILIGSAFAKGQLLSLTNDNQESGIAALLHKFVQIERRFMESKIFSSESKRICK